MDGDIRAAAEAGERGAMRALGQRLCVLNGCVHLERPDDEPEAERWLRRSLAARPGDPETAVLLAGLLLRQVRTTLELSPLYEDPAFGRTVWLLSLWQRRAEAIELYRQALAADPQHPAAATGLALALVDRPDTVDFVYYPPDDEPEPDDLDDDDPPVVLAEAEHHLRLVLAAEPGNAVAAELLARLTTAGAGSS